MWQGLLMLSIPLISGGGCPALKNICVFCASSEQIPEEYHQAAKTFGRELAGLGCGLIFGGGSVGLMGTLAKTMKAEGARVCGIIPGYLREGEGRFSLCDELILTKTLAERKHYMIDVGLHQVFE